MTVVKLFEIRDRNTLVPAMAIKVSGRDSWLLRRAGFGDTPCVYLVMLATEKCAYDPYSWTGSRTMTPAHGYILANFDDMVDGEVVDVEYILGEVKQPKVSEHDDAATT